MRTPVEHSEEMGSRAGRDVYLKLENQQRTGAFKIRGALAKLLAMDPADRERGVLTASAGNHGQGVALAARLLNVPATVVLPVGVPLTKLTAIQHHGAEVLLQGVAYDDAHASRSSSAKSEAWPTSTRSKTRTSSPGRARWASSCWRTCPISTHSWCQLAAVA